MSNVSNVSHVSIVSHVSNVSHVYILHKEEMERKISKVKV